MAFFKFRQRSQPEPAAPGRRPRKTEPAAAGPQETIETLRRRARHRLVGAAVLVGIAIVGFPLLFDTQPRPIAVDAPITIPDKDSSPPLRSPSDGGSASVPASASLDEREEVVAAATPPAREPAPVREARPAVNPPEPGRSTAADTAARVKAEQEAKAQREAEAKARRDAEAKAKREEAAARARREAEAKARAKRDEAARARALLEGRAGDDKPAESATKGRFVVQVGAFSDEAATREARQKAERAGVKTYTQVVDTSDGKRTRVRVGPFSTREEAEKASAALRKAGLGGAILSL